MSVRTMTDQQPSEQPQQRLRDAYWQWFQAIPANTELLRHESFRLRYQVYCVENPFENPDEHPGEAETDHYDSRAVCTNLIHRPSGITAGTVRLVLPLLEDPNSSFAVQEACKEPFFRDPSSFPIGRAAEISRFCISKDFRRRQGDGLYPRYEELDQQDATMLEKRVIPNMTLGLIEGLVRMSVENGVIYWCAMMEPALLRLLTRMGIHFEHIGPLVDHHGRRQPCFIKLSTLLERVRREQQEIWDVLTDDGAHADALEALEATH